MRWSIALLTLATVVMQASRARGQDSRRGPHAVEIQTRERWLVGRQQGRFTPFDESRRWVFIDSERPAGTGRRLFVTIDERDGDGRAQITTDRAGRVVRLTTNARRRPGDNLFPDDSARDARSALFDDFGRHLVLPATKVWDIVPPFAPSRLAVGERWTDTLALTTDSLGNRQALTGARVATLVSDTVVDGERLWLVRDSAAVRYNERALIEEETLDTLVEVSRDATGTLRGHMLYEPALGLFRTRDDTLELTGTMMLRYPDGRSFRQPARAERTRHWAVYDPSGYNGRQRVLEAEQERTMSEGMVIAPMSEIDKRLAAGDTAARDSLFRAWRATPEPNERGKLYDRLELWGGRDSAFVRRLKQLRIADGDTAFLLQSLADLARAEPPPAPPLDTATMRQLIAVMAEPGLPFAFDVNRDLLYENLAQALQIAPPAATHDTTRWPCTPAACYLLAEQSNSATEPRLTELGLIAHFVIDPKHWTDSLVAHASPRRYLLAQFLFLGRGVAATWPAATKAPIPAPNVNWHAWADWMNGSNALGRAARARLPAAMRTPDSPLRFETAYATAIRFTEARTGRDIVAELRRQLARATSDSARVVYEYMLNGLGEFHPTPAIVAAHFESNSSLRHELAASEMDTLFAGEPPRADSATTVHLVDRLISMTIGGGQPWRSVLPSQHQLLPAREVANETTLLLADSLPPAIRARWRTRVPVVTTQEWNARSERTGGTLFVISSVAQVGRFARLRIDSEGRVARRPDQAPWFYFASTTYYLMQLRGEWVIVGMERMIT